MKQAEILLVVVALIAIGTISVSGQVPDKPGQGFLSALKEGDSVNMTEVAGRFEFSFFDDRQMVLSHKVIEIGLDFMTVEGFSRVIETRVPVYSIKSIVKNKVPK